MSLLSIAQDVADSIGLDAPATVISNNDATAKQLLRLINRSGRRLTSEFDWQALRREHVFTSTELSVSSATTSGTTATVTTSSSHGMKSGERIRIAGANEGAYNGVKEITVTGTTTFTYTIASGTASPATGTVTAYPGAFDLPSDFGRFISDTFWDRSNTLPLAGPYTPSQWQTLVSDGIDNGIQNIFTIKNDRINIEGVPSSSGQRFAFEYITENWAQDSSGTAQSEFEADTDTALIDEHLITMDVIWRLMKAKGLDYAEEKLEAKEHLDRLTADDGAGGVILLGGGDAILSYNDLSYVTINNS